MKRAACLLPLALLALAACQSGPFSDDFEVPRMRIEGNREVEDDDLQAAAERYLRAFVANDRRPADADDAAFAMEASLRAQGYPEADVSFSIVEGELVFRVDEGPRASFGRVRFEGVESVPVEDLEAYFDFEGSGFLWLDPPLLDPARLETAVAGVADHYRRLGYLRVEVEEPRLEWNAARDAADVLVVLREGPRYTVSGVTLVGADRRYLGTDDWTGKPFTARLALSLAGDVRKRLREEGYARAEAEGTATVDDERAQAAIRIEAEVGEQVRLREMRFSGQEQTRASFMRERFEIASGDLVRRDRLERGIADLYRSRLFTSVEARLEEVAPGWTDIEIGVREAETKRLDAEAGFGTWELLRGQVTYKDFNLFGIGRVLRATALASLKSLGGEVEIEDPWILGQDNRLWLTLSALWREERFHTYEAYGLELAFERRLDRRNRVQAGYRFSIERASDIDSAVPPDVREEIEAFQRAAGLFVLWRHDGRDQRFLPRSGLYGEVGARWSATPLGASLEFVELHASATYHFDLSDYGVLAVGVLGQTIDRYGDVPLPPQFRYFLGGQQSVRSFGYEELTPTDPFGGGIGALTSAEAHVEWRPQIVGQLYGALFYDVGFVALESFSTDGDFGHGVGAGLRLYLPVGPVRLDVGYNPGELFAADERWHVHFSFGFSF